MREQCGGRLPAICNMHLPANVRCVETIQRFVIHVKPKGDESGSLALPSLGLLILVPLSSLQGIPLTICVQCRGFLGRSSGTLWNLNVSKTNSPVVQSEP